MHVQLSHCHKWFEWRSESRTISPVLKWLILIRKLGKYGKKKNPKTLPHGKTSPYLFMVLERWNVESPSDVRFQKYDCFSAWDLGHYKMWWILVLNVKVVLLVFNAPCWSIFEPRNCSLHKNIHKWVGSSFQNSDIQPHFSEARIYLNSICENLVPNTRRLPWNWLAILFSPRNILSFCQVTPAHGIHLPVSIFSQTTCVVFTGETSEIFH